MLVSPGTHPALTLFFFGFECRQFLRWCRCAHLSVVWSLRHGWEAWWSVAVREGPLKTVQDGSGWRDEKCQVPGVSGSIVEGLVELGKLLRSPV